jgi:hypothetical protein
LGVVVLHARVVCLAAALLPGAAAAQLTLGARAGYAIPTGEARAHGALADLVDGVIPLELEGGWRLSPALTVGLYGSYGVGLPSARAGRCGEAGSSCSARDLRLGVQAAWAFAWRLRGVAPWAGLGIGYEWLTLRDLDRDGVNRSFRGLELVRLQAGADVALGRVSLGPVVSYSLGRYGHAGVEGAGTSSSSAIEEKGLHGLLTLGIRGELRL